MVVKMQTIQLINAGLSMGLLHVIAGPDHLSALAALSVGSSWKAVWMGIRWGIGHSSGLIVVAIIFIAAKGDIDLRTIGRYFDMIVGFFMIGIGCFGLVQIWKIRNERNLKKNIDMESTGLLQSPWNKGLEMVETPMELPSGDRTTLHSGYKSPRKYDAGGHRTESSPTPVRSDSIVSEDDHIDDAKKLLNIIHAKCPWCICICNNALCSLCGRICGLQQAPSRTDGDEFNDPMTQNLLSFVIGVVHGVAGPGGILGVLPAVEMTQISSSVIYLGSFIFASTLSMGVFAALYGEITKRLSATADVMEYAVRLFSCSVSIIVGCIWIVLSAMGKLDEYFH